MGYFSSAALFLSIFLKIALTVHLIYAIILVQTKKKEGV